MEVGEGAPALPPGAPGFAFVFGSWFGSRRPQTRAFPGREGGAMGFPTGSGGAGEAQESGGIDLDLPPVSPAPQLANFPPPACVSLVPCPNPLTGLGAKFGQVRGEQRGRVRRASGGGGAEGTASGMPWKAFQPGDRAFPPISAPARAPRPLFSPSGNSPESVVGDLPELCTPSASAGEDPRARRARGRGDSSATARRGASAARPPRGPAPPSPPAPHTGGPSSSRGGRRRARGGPEHPRRP